MTRQELDERVRKSSRQHLWIVFLWLVIVVGAFVFNGITYFRTAGHGFQGLLSMLLVTFFAFILPLFVVPVLTKRRMRRYSLVCPYCLTPFLGERGRQTVATGRCSHCGNVIIEDATL